MKKKERKSKGLANMFSVFTKGKKKKKDQPRLSDLEVQPKPRPELDGPLPTGRLRPQLRLEQGRGWSRFGQCRGTHKPLLSQDSGQVSHQSGRGGSLLWSCMGYWPRPWDHSFLLSLEVGGGCRPDAGFWVSVEELKEALERGRLEVAWQVLALERQLETAAAAGGTSNEELVWRQSKVEALYVLLCDQVLGVLRRPLEASPERLSQALAVVSQEELEDRRASGGPLAAALEATRPRRWLQLWRGVVAEVAAERLDAQPASAPEGRSEAESRFLHMGRTMKEDLEVVVERLKPLFPDEFNVVRTYAESYHEHFATHLCTLAQFELCERDTYLLLLWVQNLYPK